MFNKTYKKIELLEDIINNLKNKCKSEIDSCDKEISKMHAGDNDQNEYREKSMYYDDMLDEIELELNIMHTELGECEEYHEDTVKENFDLSPAGIIHKLDLKTPIFKKTSSYGHFGRDDVSWEELDSVGIFKNLLK